MNYATTISNKSMFCMQVGMAIANDEDHVLDFKINEKGLKVLYVDTECGVDEMNRRYNLLKNNFRNWQGSDRFIMISRKVKIISDVLDDVEAMIQVEQPDVVYLTAALTSVDYCEDVADVLRDIVTKYS